MVKEKRFLTKKNLDVGRLRIYSLDDLDAPKIDETKKMDFSKIQAAFSINKLCAHAKVENETIIILRCADREHQFILNKHDEEEEYSLKTLKREAYIYYRHLTHQIKVIHKKINMDDGSEPFDQTYAVSIMDSSY